MRILCVCSIWRAPTHLHWGGDYMAFACFSTRLEMRGTREKRDGIEQRLWTDDVLPLPMRSMYQYHSKRAALAHTLMDTRHLSIQYAARLRALVEERRDCQQPCLVGDLVVLVLTGLLISRLPTVFAHLAPSPKVISPGPRNWKSRLNGCWRHSN